MRISFPKKTKDVFISLVKARKDPCKQSSRAMAAHTFLWMQGHALLPLPVCADSGVGTLCTGKAWDWSQGRKLFVRALKHKSVFWRTGLTSSAMQLPAMSFELHQGLTCSPTRKVTPTSWSGDGIFHSDWTPHLPCYIGIIINDNLTFYNPQWKCTFPLAAFLIKRMNPCVN